MRRAPRSRNLRPILSTVAGIGVGCTLLMLSYRNNVYLEQSRSPSSDEPASGEYTLADYVADCERELGTIPTFGCFQGQMVPVHDSDQGVEITHSNYGGVNQHCDRPSLLQNDDDLVRVIGQLAPCVPHTRLGTSRAQEGYPTKWVWSCRRYFNRPADDWHFDDINMIGHNPQTGATCYFVTHINRFRPTRLDDLGNNGQYVPSPRFANERDADGRLTSRARYVQRLWKSPEAMTSRASWQGGSQPCTQCHDNDAFVHTPFFQQVLKPDGTPVVPSHPFGPYSIVGDRRYFGRPEWRIRRLASPQAERCTTCHTIGDRRSCGDFTRWATGIQHHSRTTQVARRHNWMPPRGGRAWIRNPDEPHDTLDPADLEAVRFINRCCENPHNPECIWEAPPPGRPFTPPATTASTRGSESHP